MGKRRMTLLVLLCSLATARAEVSVKAGVDAAEIGVDDVLTYTVTVQSDGRFSGISLEPPRFENAADAQGPSTSQSTQMSFGGGQSMLVSTLTYSWYVAPKAEGTLRIGPARLTFGGKTYTTEAVSVRVVAGSVRPRAGGGRSPFDDPVDPFGNDPFGDLFPRRSRQERQQGDVRILADVSKKKAYVGEAVTLTYRLVRDIQVTGLSLEQPPKLAQFRVEEVKLADEVQWQPITLGGKRLMAAVVKQMVLFPIQPGSQNIGESAWQVQVMGGGFFAMPQAAVRRAPAIAIEVLPVPAEGRPPGWDGAVGRFSMTAAVDQKAVAVNEPMTLRVQVTGDGDLRSVASLPLPQLPDFRVYDPKITEQVDGRRGRLVSSKTFEYVLIPRAAGRQEIPPIRWPYFDPEGGGYATAVTPSFTVEVARGAGGEVGGEGLPSAVPGREISVVGHDLRYLKPLPERPDGVAVPLWWSRGFMLAWMVPALVNLGLALFSWRRRSLEQNVSAVRARRALAAASRILAAAGRTLRNGDSKVFHEQISEGVSRYVADRFDQPRAGLTLVRMDGLLEEAGCPTELRQQLAEILHECDYSRFTPAASQGDEMNARLGRARKLVKAIESTLGRARRARRSSSVAAGVFLLLLVSGLARAESAPPPEDVATIWQRATQTYDQGSFEESEGLWQSLVDRGLRHPSLHYNLANAQLKLGKIGLAVANYERTLADRPRDEDALVNLHLAQERAVDEVARTPRRQDVVETVLSYLPADAVAVVALGLFMLSQLVLALMIVGRLRGGGWLTVLVVLVVLAVLHGGYVATSVMHARGHQLGVVLAPKVEARSGPGDENATLFIVHEGLTVSVRDRQKGWALVTLPNDLTGWVPLAALALV